MANHKRGVLILIALIFLIRFVSAADFNYVIANSEDWKDVYSAMHYANLNGADGNFLVSTSHGTLMLNSLNKNSKVKILSSSKNPYVFNYGDLYRAKSFASVDEVTSDNLNLRLMDDLPSIENFVIIGDSYGFSAVAVAPYASVSKSWVIFANRANVYQVDAALSKKNVKKIIIYGYVDREVIDLLSPKYNVEIINNDDKFKDNIEIVKKYKEIKDMKQVVLTNGEFIEKEIMSGLEPILFTGRDDVPEQIRDYIKSSDITVGVLIGNELVGAATTIRRSTGISVMVKFARGARAQTSGVAAVEGLDLFPLPTPAINLTIYSVKYNRANSQFEITYKSSSNVPVYVKGTITLSSGDEKFKVGDINPVFIAPGDFKTIIYSVNLTSSTDLRADISTLFGEVSTSLDRVLTANIGVDVVNVLDKCILDEKTIKSIKYNKQKKSFFVTIENPNDVDCYVDVELNDVSSGYTKLTIGTEGSVIIPSKKSKSIPIPQELNDEDLSKNSMIDLSVFSGEKEDSLVHTFRGKIPLEIETFSVMMYVIIAVIVIIILLLIWIFFLWKRRKDDDED